MGLIGVFLGTVVSNLSTNVWVEPYLLYKYGFKQKLRDYFLRYGIYTCTVVIAGWISRGIIMIFPSKSWMDWLIQAILCSILVGAILIIPFLKTKEAQVIKNLLGLLNINRK